MAGFDYGKMQATATRLLERFNQGVVTVTKTLPGTPDPATPWEPVLGVSTVYTLKATVKGVSKQFIDGTTILASDLEITAAAFPAEPDPADVVAIDGKVVTVLRVMRIPAAGKIVCWRFLVRG